MIKDLALSERPRERLIFYGGEDLALHELLAIIIGSGIKGKNVLELSIELINLFGGIEGLLKASVADLMTVKGLGQVKAVQLKAAFMLARKIQARRAISHAFISCVQDAVDLLEPYFAGKMCENIYLLLRNSRGEAIGIRQCGQGTLTEVAVHPREIFSLAIEQRAHSFILAHNHPSGSTQPSQADERFTIMLVHASGLMGIALDDHLIFGSSPPFSFRRDRWKKGDY